VAGPPRMVAGWPTHVPKAPPFCPNSVVVELKRKIVEGKGRKEGEAGRQSLADRPCLACTKSILSFSTSSCFYHAHSTDQKHQKLSQFLSSFSKVLFFLKYSDFMLCNDEINMLWKRKNKKWWKKGGK
jgi:hypothetical protein